MLALFFFFARGVLRDVQGEAEPWWNPGHPGLRYNSKLTETSDEPRIASLLLVAMPFAPSGSQ